MLLAYLRGLLQPRYDQGQRSVIRENMILSAISAELDVQQASLQMVVDAGYVPLMGGDGARKLYSNQEEQIKKIRHLAELDESFLKKVMKFAQGSRDDLFALYEALEKAGMVGTNVKDI